MTSGGGSSPATLGKRADLKEIANNKELPMEERFAARLKLAQLPRNGSPTRVRNRCEVTGRPRAFYRKMRMSRIALRDLGNKGLIPVWLNRAGRDQEDMTVSDPLGDMLTRIRNAQMRSRPKVSTPASKLRAPSSMS